MCRPGQTFKAYITTQPLKVSTDCRPVVHTRQSRHFSRFSTMVEWLPDSPELWCLCLSSRNSWSLTWDSWSPKSSESISYLSTCTIPPYTLYCSMSLFLYAFILSLYFHHCHLWQNLTNTYFFISFHKSLWIDIWKVVKHKASNYRDKLKCALSCFTHQSPDSTNSKLW